MGLGAGLLPSDKTLVFVENHDTERGGDTLSYRDGATNTLATEFMLARGYGTPQVYSSFRFTSNDASPPADRNGYITDTTCDAGWACTDRIPGVANMVGWHNYVGDAELRHWYDDGVSLISFSRGAKGWIALNNSTAPQSHTFTTGLRGGTYCDLIHGTIDGGTCTGPTVTVTGNGAATVTVPGKDAVALNTNNLTRQN